MPSSRPAAKPLPAPAAAASGRSPRSLASASPSATGRRRPPSRRAPRPPRELPRDAAAQACACAQSAITSASSCDRLQVAERGEARQPERVEVVAGEQPQVGVRRLEQRGRRVVDEIPLEDALDQQRVLAGPARGSAPRPPRAARTPPLAPGRRRAPCASSPPSAATSSRSWSSASPPATPAPHEAAASNASPPPPASPRARSSPCASDGNQASNGDGGR